MSQIPNTAIAVIGIDIGKNSFHLVGHDARGAIVLRQKWSRECSNQRPDTLMQDRRRQFDEIFFNARPDHTSGSSPTWSSQ